MHSGVRSLFQRSATYISSRHVNRVTVFFFLLLSSLLILENVPVPPPSPPPLLSFFFCGYLFVYCICSFVILLVFYSFLLAFLLLFVCVFCVVVCALRSIVSSASLFACLRNVFVFSSVCWCARLFAQMGLRAVQV